MARQKPLACPGQAKATRDGFGEALVELGGSNRDVVVLSADLTSSTRADWFKNKFPQRFFAIGVAEQDMFGTAAGLALCGKTVFACTFSVFASGRAWDQLRISVCYMNLNVKIGASHGGISVGADGATHQALEDVALMVALPNMKVIVPADSIQAKKATLAAARMAGPFYLRLGRSALPLVTEENAEFEIGRADILKDGSDVTLIACGIMVHNALEASRILEKKGIKGRVLNMHTIKPPDERTITDSAKKTGALVTCEEHSIVGGLGAMVSGVIARIGPPVPIEMVGTPDVFGESGEAEELIRYFHLAPEDIAAAAERAIKRKKK
jgi:transketolase